MPWWEPIAWWAVGLAAVLAVWAMVDAVFQAEAECEQCRRN